MNRTTAAIIGLAFLAACSKAPETSGPPSGERLFSQCAVCHTAAAPDTPAAKLRLVGPPLWGVYGKTSASLPDFNYSRAMKSAGLVWDDATLDKYLESPQALVPGTLMSFAGEPDAAKRAALVEYLKTLK